MHKHNFSSPLSLLQDRISSTKKLIRAAERHGDITKKIQSYLPTDFAEHCEFGSIRGSSIILFADSAAWATRLRFHSSDLLRYINNEYKYSLSSIKFKVMPLRGKRKKPKPKPFHIDSSNIDSIRQLSSTVKHQGLSDALVRLAAITEKKSKK